MKKLCRILLAAATVCAAACSVCYAIRLYRTKYAPRYFKGNAC